VLQEFELEYLTVNGKLGAVPWFGSLNLYSDRWKPYRNGQRERISPSEAMIYQWTSLVFIFGGRTTFLGRTQQFRNSL
jgi:hypothetical protein